MIFSMTGYGRGVETVGDMEITVEIRTVNNRFLDLVMKAPRSLANYEQQIREMVSKYIKRGRVNLWIGITSETDKYQDLVLNKSLITAYTRVAQELNDSGIPGNIDLNTLLALPDILSVDIDADVDEETWLCAQKAIESALVALNSMRNAEGEHLYSDFVARITNLEQIIIKIEEMSANAPRENLDKLRERIRKIVPDDAVDTARLELELALIADRIDITEECVRFHSHNKLFLDILANEASQGRKLNYLLQEMNREANTIGSKTSLAEVSHLVVVVKDEIEKIREQIQNIE
ncbi:MAG TPA: YicC family protein [bacterium]|nr:YicC family protein [bacterium]HPN43104.1 YicC family protein [bacterium]